MVTRLPSILPLTVASPETRTTSPVTCPASRRSPLTMTTPSTVSPRGTVTSPEMTTIASSSWSEVCAGASAGSARAASRTRKTRDGTRRIKSPAYPDRSALHRIRLAQLADPGCLIELARHAADDHHPHSLTTRPHLALGAGGDAGHVVRVEREALAVDLDLAAPLDRQEDLLLAVFGVVVLVVVLEIRGQVDHLQPERLDPEFGSRPFESSAIDRLHLVDSLHRVLAHRRLPFCRRPPGGSNERSCFFIPYVCNGRHPAEIAPAQGGPYPGLDSRPRCRRRLGGGPGGTDDRPPRWRAADEQERPLRPFRLQAGAAAGDGRRRRRTLPRPGHRPRAGASRWGPTPAGYGRALPRPAARLLRRLLLRRHRGRVRRPSRPRPRRDRRLARCLDGGAGAPGRDRRGRRPAALRLRALCAGDGGQLALPPQRQRRGLRLRPRGDRPPADGAARRKRVATVAVTQPSGRSSRWT